MNTQTDERCPGVVRFLACLLPVLLWGGCANLSETLARKASAGSVHGMIEGLAAQSPEALAAARKALLGDVNLSQAAREMAAAVVSGSMDGLNQEDLEARSRALLTAVFETLRQQGDATLIELIDRSGPHLEETLRRAVAASILSAGQSFRTIATRDLEEATRILVRTAIDTTLTTATAAASRSADELGPVAGRIAHDLMQEAMTGLKDGLSPADVRTYMREGALGFSEGLRSGINDQVSKLETSLIAVVVALVTILALAITSLVLLWRRLQLAVKTLSIIASQINTARDVDERSRALLKESIRTSADKNGVQGWLSSFLKQRGY